MRNAIILVSVLLLSCGCSMDRSCIEDGKHPETQDIQAAKQPVHAVQLLDGGMDRWQPINFGGEGDVYFKDDELNLDYGNPLTGIKYKGDPTSLFGEGLSNYVITLQAQRVEGVDMFLGLTFPVGTQGHVSLVLGGWAGAITGLSNLDGLNASENPTTQYHAFEEKRWYDIKVQVTDEKIQCWLEDRVLVDIKRSDYKQYTTHGAVVDTKPFGMFSYDTWGKVRGMRVWKLD